jgi:tetratricopeptide (TPR) repeat protein
MSGYLGGAEVRPEALAAADQSLKLAIEIDPNFAEAHVLRGQLYVLMKKLPMARAALTTAEQIGTDDPWLQLNWAELLKAEGRGDEVAGRSRRVLASGTTNKKARGAALEGLIEYHKHLGELDEADRLYHEHIALDPTSAWSYGNYARFLLCYRDDFDGAIEQAGRGLARMDYWAGRAVLGAALTRKWAEQLTHGKADEAERTRKPLAAVDLDADAVKLYKEVCPRGSATGTIERAVAIFRASRPAILRRGPESQPAKD